LSVDVLQYRGMEFEVGPISALLEASASAVGVGMVLGGFVAGLAALLDRIPRDMAERRVLNAGYGFAAFCLAVRLVEIVQTI
jgi:hypothetical protein